MSLDDFQALLRGFEGTGPQTPAFPDPRFDHLAVLSDPLGIWEHAEHTTPRAAHGFCTDDNARALIVLCRDATRSDELDQLAGSYLRFVLDARVGDGTFHNRRREDGAWLDDVGSDDSQGRAWWALGVAARRGRTPQMRLEAAAAFDDCGGFGSHHLRPNAFAILGVVELLDVTPGHVDARALLHRAVEPLTSAAATRIPWFEPRLTYDNARLPEALLAAGATLDDPSLVRRGLRLLTWLVEAETIDDHFSFAPAAGWAPGEPRPGFDQQPVEAVAMAEACHRAWTITGQAVWRDRSLAAARWFLGDNDTGDVLYDARTGGTRDGLMVGGVNQNQGAESTLAGLAALQVAASGFDEPAETSP
ncbi:MAG TPA: hypothetical protein VGA69_05880 [Nitriliruptorales bacterium]